jgi:hypothetical protein
LSDHDVEKHGPKLTIFRRTCLHFLSEVFDYRIKQVIKKLVGVLMHVAPEMKTSELSLVVKGFKTETYLNSSFSFLSFSTNARGDTVPLSAGLAAIWINKDRRAENRDGGDTGMTGPTFTMGAGVGVLVVLWGAPVGGDINAVAASAAAPPPTNAMWCGVDRSRASAVEGRRMWGGLDLRACTAAGGGGWAGIAAARAAGPIGYERSGASHSSCLNGSQ